MSVRLSDPDRAMQIVTVPVGAQRLRVAIGGAPQAERTLLLFNGIGASVEAVAPFMAEFEHTRVLSFDVPGVGESPVPRLPYRLRDVARWGAGVLDALDIRSADVFGVSWGGAAAQEFALRHPQRCRSLTLAATSAGVVMVPGQLGVLLKLLSPRRYLDPAYLIRVGGSLYGGVLRSERELLAMHAMALRGPSQLGYLYQLLAVAGWTSWFGLGRIDAPALILMGDDDPIVPAINGHLMASRLRDATVESIDCGHLFMLTRPREIARRVERFLAARPLAPTAGAATPGRTPTAAPIGES